MAIDVPVSSDTITPTLAPSLMHCSAWASCFCGWLSAFTTAAVRPAFLKAAVSSGLSNCCQRGDDVVSGSSTQTCVPVAVDFALCPAAPPTRTAIVSFFTPPPPPFRVPQRGTVLRPAQVFNRRGRGSAVPDPHLLPAPYGRRCNGVSDFGPSVR